VQRLAERLVELERRMESSALDFTPRRVAASLLRLSERLGKPHSDGSLELPFLSHQLLSEYVGTSREVVTFNMNRLRRLGLADYSRRSIRVYAHALKDHMGDRMGFADLVNE